MSSYYQILIAKKIQSHQMTHLDSSIIISTSAYSVTVEIPFPCIDNLYDRFMGKKLAITNDLRLLYQPGDEPDSAGITSVLMFSAAVPPLSPLENIHAFIPGFRYHVDLHSMRIRSAANYQWSDTWQEDFSLDTEDQIEQFSNNLDQLLYKLCRDQNPLILFSGGVDSSVLTRRASHMSWQQTCLVHFSFGSQDPETRIALSIAERFNFPMEIIPYEVNLDFECLDNAVRIYRQCITDIATISNFHLSAAIMEKFKNSRLIIDGLGADRICTREKMAQAFLNIYKIPKFVRRCISHSYKTFRLWKSTSKFEYYLRVIKRSADLGKIAGFRAINQLLNIGYRVGSEEIRSISAYCLEWLKKIAPTNEDKELLPLINNGFLSAGNQVYKNKSPLSLNSYHIYYSSLDKTVVDLAIKHMRFWPGNETPKQVQKKLLCQSLPEQIVYHQKQGFKLPLANQFSQPRFLEHLCKLRDKTAPLYDYIEHNFLIQAIQHVKSKKELPLQIYNFLWGIAFNNSWLRQLNRISKEIKQSIQYQNAL